MILIWLNKNIQRRWWLVGLLMITLLVIPPVYKRLNLIQITVFATKNFPVILVQDRGKITLINSINSEIVKYVILPFLAEGGINQINCAIDFNVNSNQQKAWSELRKKILIKQFLEIGQSNFHQCQGMQITHSKFPLLQFKIAQKKWLLIAENINYQDLQTPELSWPSDVLVWTEKDLPSPWLDLIKPKIAIAIPNNLKPNLEKQLQQRGVQLYWTYRDGAIQWTPQQGFTTTVEDIRI